MDPLLASPIKKGDLLLAMPEVSSGIFRRSVILVCEHSSVGSFGLILNKSLDSELPGELADLVNGENKKVHIRLSGPVQSQELMLLHDDASIKNTLAIGDKIFLGGDLEFLESSMSSSDGPNVLLCFGYAGWGPSQLERDLMQGVWILAEASHNYLFSSPPETLWETILKDKGGKFATLAMIPEDLSLN